MTPTIRPARLDPAGLAADAAACAAIYAPYVTGTSTSFEEVPPSAEEMAARIAACSATHAWLVAERPHGEQPNGEQPNGERRDGEILGYAYGSAYRARPAYRWTAEVTVYLAHDAPRRTGAGRALYDALLTRLAERGYHRAMAGVTLPNDASVGLHRAVGFTEIGTERRVGWKLGAWRDVLRLQRDLEVPDGREGGGKERAAPAEPR
ncbi:GNAT family N-acetyltransferase [Isoptericola variabilis]|uniref:GCN5-related N-acetyltransferase n=1 Tax=Isoptericola variabilis (strain 225) TaxID=743718 RepID=F6FPM1_ISOV2|nr:GNAT family N-acetyltransferase [Isoptericola variabilis]AEG44753.1 GCN5-related N-acetyltransferase [Isoptericola variabilis 225]TWH32366.1 phosphinothricin acetyltransferase [Isoptericola variabilis J7]